MEKSLSVILLFIFSMFASIRAQTYNLVGAWKGPKDLMVNFCSVADNQLSVCYCGIFRTYGWSDVALTVKGNSLIIKASDGDTPFEGHLCIEAVDKMTGTITMGHPCDDWYFSGETEFIKQKAIMPEDLNHELEGIIHTPDYGMLALGCDFALETLSKVSPKSYGYAEKGMVEDLLNAKVYPVTPDDMLGFCRVRSIQIDACYGIFSYPYFKCSFRNMDGKVFFEKTTGSQRKSGYVYQNKSNSLIFLGGWSVNDEPQTTYDSTNSVAGIVYKIAPDKAIMIFPTNNNRVEIYELMK